MERPLDTIRSFNAAAEGTTSRRASYQRQRMSLSLAKNLREANLVQPRNPAISTPSLVGLVIMAARLNLTRPTDVHFHPVLKAGITTDLNMATTRIKPKENTSRTKVHLDISVSSLVT